MRWRKGKTGVLVALLMLTGVVAPTDARAGLAAPSGGLDIYGGGELGQDVINKLVNCPQADDFPEGVDYYACIVIKAYEGELQLGTVHATIDDPLNITIGVGFAPGAGIDDPVFVFGGAGGNGGGEAEFEPVKISGGILGIPELDPIIDLEPLGLLSLSASPEIGDIGAELAGAEGATADLTHLSPISLPISIKLNNTLFGDNCHVGTPDDPIAVNLTTWVSSPPTGVQPMVGDFGTGRAYQFRNYTGGNVAYSERHGAVYVDNAFEVPGATSCDLLPTGVHDTVQVLSDQLEGTLGLGLGLDQLIGSDAGLFDPVINNQVGLPSPAGRNYMRIKLDTIYALAGNHTLDVVQGMASEREWHTTPSHLDFGEVEVGSEAFESMIVSNPRSTPLALAQIVSGLGHEDLTITSDGCSGQTLAEGDECQVEIRFAPTSVGSKTRIICNGAVFICPLGIGGLLSTADGVGVALEASPLVFGNVLVGTAAPEQTAVFTNAGTQPRTLSGGAALAAHAASRINSWEVTDDRCLGQTLDPGEFCEVDVRSVPNNVGSDRGNKRVSLEVRGAGGSALGSTLITAVAIAPLTSEPSALDFGEIAVGEQSPTQMATLENTGTSPVTASGGVALRGTASRFASWDVVSDGCSGQTLNPGEICEVEVRLSPNTTGNKAVNLDVNGPGPTRLGSVELVGTGISP